MVLKDGKELSANLVVDCSGRNSSMPKWLEAAGYSAPPQTTVNSGLGEPVQGCAIAWNCKLCEPALCADIKEMSS